MNMTRLAILCVGWALSVSLLSAPALAAERYRAAEVHMGTRFTITIHAPNQEAARGAFLAAFARIEELDTALSDYQPDSELNRLCRQSPTPTPVEISRDLYRVLDAAQQVSRQSEGAFDVTVGPLTRLWRVARKQKKLPPAEALRDAKAAVGYQHLKLSQHEGKFFAQLDRPNMQLDLGGIAKGYALDKALATLAEQGIASALVDGGGDVACSAAPPGTAGWRIGVAALEPNAAPSQTLEISHRGVATSGDAWQFVEIDGRRFSHILNPQTGLGLELRSSVTVLAATGMQADALASTVSVLGPEAGLQLINQLDDVEAVIVVAKQGRVTTHASAGIAPMPQSRAGESSAESPER